MSDAWFGRRMELRGQNLEGRWIIPAEGYICKSPLKGRVVLLFDLDVWFSYLLNCAYMFYAFWYMFKLAKWEILDFKLALKIMLLFS